jgi:hypothetical protein
MSEEPLRIAISITVQPTCEATAQAQPTCEATAQAHSESAARASDDSGAPMMQAGFDWNGVLAAILAALGAYFGGRRNGSK